MLTKGWARQRFCHAIATRANECELIDGCAAADETSRSPFAPQTAVEQPTRALFS